MAAKTIKVVDVTPAAFTGPDAQNNIAAANAAADKLHDVVRAKSNLLGELVTTYFGGIDGLCKAVKQANDGDDEIAKEVREQWESLEERHSDASAELVAAMQGK